MIQNTPGVELFNVCKKLNLQIKKLNTTEYNKVIEMFLKKFIKDSNLNWDNLIYDNEIHQEFAWLCFDKILANKEIIVFFEITKSSFALYLPNGADLKMALNNAYTFNFYVTNPNFDFYLAYNDDLDLLKSKSIII